MNQIIYASTKLNYKVNRIYHTWDKWECFPAGFFNNQPPRGLTDDDCEKMYAELLANETEFKKQSIRVISEWKNSCEHNLTNERMNRIAWMGQAALCIKHGIPARYRGGYNLLTKEQQVKADEIALDVINLWMQAQGYEQHTQETIKSKTEADLY